MLKIIKKWFMKSLFNFKVRLFFYLINNVVDFFDVNENGTIEFKLMNDTWVSIEMKNENKKKVVYEFLYETTLVKEK